jgi:hypothetical protein
LCHPKTPDPDSQETRGVMYADLVGTDQAPHTPQTDGLGWPNISVHVFFSSFSFSFSVFSFYVF